jgi:broad specificity phosphatase PhoE
MTHGGLICALIYHLGGKDVISNCSVVCTEFDKEKEDFNKILFQWNFK